MIGLLAGSLEAVQTVGKRTVVLLLVGGVGYEVQVLPRSRSQLPAVGAAARLHTHLQVRDDALVLFGFSSAIERDVFRLIVTTQGVGVQTAIALMDTLELPTLIQAIVADNYKLLAKAPGIGPKGAQRICLELKTKFAEWRDGAGPIAPPAAGPVADIYDEVELTLSALGYSDREVTAALDAVGRQTALAKTGDAETWIREAIAWLSLNA